MILSEAVEIASMLVSLYPNGTPPDMEAYIGGLARVLMEYPRSVAECAHDPVHGVPRETRFLPTPHDLHEWCDRETKKLRASMEVESAARDRDRERDERIRSREEEQRLIENRAQRPTGEELETKYGPHFGLLSPIEPRRQRCLSNRRLFDRAAARGGHDAGGGIVISPHLIATLREPEVQSG
jgi:hypothetical protein